MKTNNEINYIKALIERLKHYKGSIVPNFDEALLATLIVDYDQISSESLFDETIRYLQSVIDCKTVKAVKTNNYKLTYHFDGYEFTDVVNAEDEQHAFDYLCWISNYNDDYYLFKVEICDELPSYWCPVYWVKPDPAYVDPEVAQYRSLIKSLEVAGITQHDYYTPELDKIMRQSLGYTQRIVRDTGDDFGLWNFAPKIYVEYTRQNHYTLRVEVKEDK